MNHPYLSEIKRHASLPLPLRMEYLSSVDSTNKQLRQAAQNGADEDILLIAEEQSAGKGRFDRRFFSPPETGIYMSLLLHPEFDLSLFPLLTPLAGTAAAEAIEAVSGEKVGIKWVNDLYIGTKKICGILAECGISPCGKPYAVIGIGINAYLPEEIPNELIPTLGAVWQTRGDVDLRPALIGAFLTRFYRALCAMPKDVRFMDAYRSHSMLIGKNVLVHNAAVDTAKTGEGVRALCLDICRDGSLLVEYENGTKEPLKAGEVTLSL